MTIYYVIGFRPPNSADWVRYGYHVISHGDQPLKHPCCSESQWFVPGTIEKHYAEDIP
jgi:hypothetical protein